MAAGRQARAAAYGHCAGRKRAVASGSHLIVAPGPASEDGNRGHVDRSFPTAHTCRVREGYSPHGLSPAGSLAPKCAAHAEALAQRLRQIALDKKSTRSEAISAMKLLIERAHGKPSQQVTQTTEYTHPDLIPTEELMRLLAEEEGA